MTRKKSQPCASCWFAGPTQDLLELMIIMMISMMMVGKAAVAECNLHGEALVTNAVTARRK